MGSPANHVRLLAESFPVYECMYFTVEQREGDKHFAKASMVQEQGTYSEIEHVVLEKLRC